MVSVSPDRYIPVRDVQPAKQRPHESLLEGSQEETGKVQEDSTIPSSFHDPMRYIFLTHIPTKKYDTDGWTAEFQLRP